MEQLFSQYQKEIAVMRERLSSPDVSGSERDRLQKDMQNIENSILEMSKFLLKGLKECSDNFASAQNDLDSVEGQINMICNSKGREEEELAKPPTVGTTCSELAVETNAPMQINFPTCNFNIDMEVLSEIGFNKIEKIADESKSVELVRKVPRDKQEPQIWTRESDYFTLEKDAKPSTFNEIYKTPKSVYKANQ